MIKCPECKTENPIDIFKAEEGSKILCRGCNEFIVLQFADGKTPKKVKKEIVDTLKKSFSKKIKFRF